MTETDKQQNVQYTDIFENVFSKRKKKKVRILCVSSCILYSCSSKRWCCVKFRINIWKWFKFILINIHQKLFIAKCQLKRFISKFSIKIRCIIIACLEENQYTIFNLNNILSLFEKIFFFYQSDQFLLK